MQQTTHAACRIRPADLKGPNLLITEDWQAKVQHAASVAYRWLLLGMQPWLLLQLVMLLSAPLLFSCVPYTLLTHRYVADPQVADFDLSKQVVEGLSMHSTQSPVNPRWLAPELVKGARATKASDVFSFGERLPAVGHAVEPSGAPLSVVVASSWLAVLLLHTCRMKPRALAGCSVFHLGTLGGPMPAGCVLYELLTWRVSGGTAFVVYRCVHVCSERMEMSGRHAAPTSAVQCRSRPYEQQRNADCTMPARRPALAALSMLG